MTDLETTNVNPQKNTPPPLGCLMGGGGNNFSYLFLSRFGGALPQFSWQQPWQHMAAISPRFLHRPATHPMQQPEKCGGYIMMKFVIYPMKNRPETLGTVFMKISHICHWIGVRWNISTGNDWLFLMEYSGAFHGFLFAPIH